MSCPLRVINRDRLLAMALASALLIIGVILLRVYVWLGVALVVMAWLFIGYNLYQTIPDKAEIFIPAIVIICSAFLTAELLPSYKPVAFTLYGIGWLILGWIMSSEIDDKWMGPLAAVLIAGSYIFVIPWQEQNNIVYGIGLPMISTGLTIMTIIHSYPTEQTIQAAGPECLEALAEKIPQLKPYVNDINCVIETGCFDELSTLPASDTPTYIAKVVEAITCAGGRCDVFKQLATETDCFIKSCLQTVLANPPTTAAGWASAILLAYTTCGEKTCGLPPLF